MEKLISFIGIFILIAIAWVFSKNKKAVNYKTVLMGTLIQLIFALLVLKFPPGRKFFEIMNDVIIKVISFSNDGAKFIFGGLIDNQSLGFIFAFQVLPTIIFFSSLMSVLYYLGIMQKIVLFFAKIMTKFMGTSGAESLSASANIFVGQTEAPLVVRPYVSEMTQSELMAVMTGGMATIAGGVMAAYVGILKDYLPNIAGHLLAASIMSAPAALVMAKIIVPETEEPKTKGVVKLNVEIQDANIIDAAANGATTGMTLALNVAACLVAFMALLALCNYIVGFISPGLTLEKIMGWIFYPLAWIMGVPSNDLMKVAEWMGQKTILNEFVAYFNMANFLKDNPNMISERAIIISSYALCGFSNFLSIAIQIGGIGGIAPNRRHDLAKLGLYAVLAGSLACFMTATIAGLLI
ncbi:MAG TPA: nucleoside transporter C-terminal domain-containing protein [Elusimicrobiales bacterium]|nr:nucleoside transporter C-terminal domain-containing protein [Elusimicrobiales bacterium]HOL63489.1 nucleoside transporter C-terminal domain-containing protein [Elusimicrobiales bacterium]HPO94903.1 nucleoside transporter C-terminal domain-containing protein [Elusimicrobiales bacterium]